jgi:biopolymer transport protein ExbD
MTFKTHSDIAKGRIDPAPMVDVVFLLLIFLVLSSPFVLQPGYGTVMLPAVNNPTTTMFQSLVVTVSRDNLFFFNGQATTLDGLRQSLMRAAQQTHNPELILKADRQVSYDTVAKVMSMAFETGISVVNLATRPELPVAPQTPR